MGIYVQSVSDKLEPRDLSETPETWAYVVTPCDPVAVQSSLETVQALETVPRTGRIFVSAITHSSVTIR